MPISHVNQLSNEKVVFKKFSKILIILFPIILQARDPRTKAEGTGPGPNIFEKFRAGPDQENFENMAVRGSQLQEVIAKVYMAMAKDPEKILKQVWRK